ncbi:MAG: DivIVA domain-containing protein [Firmicutes bacterium]|uniref:DivIVA domain-containing protein n=1 Tax=Melghirimyces thermohalophilus TaxID=1236220 RepID=A0A1G6HLI4_9BACL|nr:DivIVA domain-containing protein [Melghirimyces thermohalophilus]MDA8354389.1 DivIVA domain-containing protein [Bacillota bacterium]SDB94755.1 DivIVA domain-containing protein [Melghirimyces thermohalophilus]
MRLTPRDIFNKDFKTSIRGYDTDEVNEFLDQVIRSYEDVLAENEQLKKELKKSKQNSMRHNRVDGEQDRIIQDILRRLERLEQVVRR